MGRKMVRALVKKDILVWARKSAGYELEELAASSRFKNIAKWESGELQPTIGQLRDLGKKYKRPLAVFYLQEVPDDFQVIRDFRRLPGEGLPRLSPRLRLQIRAAQERREVALDLLSEMGEVPPKLALAAKLDDDPEEVAARIRGLLKITESLQAGWKVSREAFNAWRRHIENVGVLVFQMDGIDTSEASGFALAEQVLPAIAINRKDAISRRVFTLLHEFVHLLLRESGVSEFELNLERPPEEQRIEVFCNAVAAATIFPRVMFLREPTIQKHPASQSAWSDAEIGELADTFGASRTAVVRRLLTFNLTTNDFYVEKEQQYREEYFLWLKNRKADYKEKEFRGRNMPNEAISLLGRNFVRMVLTPYHNDRITLRDASAHLNLKTRHIPKLEKALMAELAL